ncbi:MAG: phage holin family protein [Sutterellaceae bacterium]|nr:phage holin family protein [Burkholderiaceae bacterium]MCX7902048.1 phage holin family protein [Burkholderiaceae bacterium]MDW8430335.1 phage holin family protein [Sutterellaceae bacterium]
MLAALRRALAAGYGLLLTRAESAGVELAQARAQAARWFALALAAGLFALLAAASATAALTLALWPWFGWLTLLALAAAYAVLAGYLARRVQREVRAAPPLFAETLAELQKDRAALFGLQESADGR